MRLSFFLFPPSLPPPSFPPLFLFPLPGADLLIQLLARPFAGIRNFIVAETVKVASDDTALRRERTYLAKLNLVLVQVLKQEWPHNWPTFIGELVQASTVNLALCENNMAILKLLSEEIFDFSAEQMTQRKTQNLKTQISGEFSEIFRLCCEVRVSPPLSKFY